MDASEESVATVQKMIAGFRVSQIVSTAADLSLAEHLADGPRGAEEIATIEDADPGATLRLMRACVSLGLLAYEDGRFSGTESLRVLHREAPNSLRNYVLRSAAPGMWLPIGRMRDAVRTGASQDTRALGRPLFD
jgi:Dimerisation domain